MPRSAAVILAVLATCVPASALAAPIELRAKRGDFWVFDDVDGSVENANWFARDPFLAGYRAVEDGYIAAHPDDTRFLVILTTWSLPQGVGALYQAVANDVQGIGYEHIAPLDAVIPAPYFDDTPDTIVEGFLHMNRWPQFVRDDGSLDELRISLIFGQELGHAFGSFVHFEGPGGQSNTMLGRAEAHWSFYLDTPDSPLQGHAWTDNGDGTFTTNQPPGAFAFSDLDLYLMGLVPPEDVEPWFLIEDPSDCRDAEGASVECAARTAFGFAGESYTAAGTRRDITIDDVLAVEGPRVPAFPDAPATMEVGFLLIKRPEESLGRDELELVGAIVREGIAIFDAQTRGYGRLINRTESEPGTGESTTDGGVPGIGSASDESGATESVTPAADSADAGCGCRSSRATASWAVALLVLGCSRRRAPDYIA